MDLSLTAVFAKKGPLFNIFYRYIGCETILPPTIVKCCKFSGGIRTRTRIRTTDNYMFVLKLFAVTGGS